MTIRTVSVQPRSHRRGARVRPPRDCRRSEWERCFFLVASTRLAQTLREVVPELLCVAEYFRSIGPPESLLGFSREHKGGLRQLLNHGRGGGALTDGAPTERNIAVEPSVEVPL